MATDSLKKHAQKTKVLDDFSDPSITSLGFIREADLAREAAAAPQAADTSLTGRRVGSYEVAQRLGAGAMGVVYRARDINLNRDVALKILPRLPGSSGEPLARLEREARILASLNHPNVGAIYGVEDRDGVHALVLELVEGETLADRLSPGAPLAAEEALDIARQIAGALDAAHGKGIVHRDLKPANVKIAPDGVVKVLDFGLAAIVANDGDAPGLGDALTAAAGRAGAIVGTPNYMAPEQALGRTADPRSDIWSLGLLIYQMVTGRLPFAVGTPATLMGIAAALAALPKRVQTDLTPLLARALAIDVADRYQSMSEAIADLDKARERIDASRPRSLTPWVRDRFGPAVSVAGDGADTTRDPAGSAELQVDDAAASDTSSWDEPDFTAADALTEIRSNQTRLREYRARAAQLKDVEEVVSRKVLADYDARYQDLERKASPLVHTVRHEHERLRRAVAQVRRTDEDARLLKAEADLRHAVGEIDDTELAERSREPNDMRSRCAERLAAFEAVEARFMAALQTEP